MLDWLDQRLGFGREHERRKRIPWRRRSRGLRLTRLESLEQRRLLALTLEPGPVVDVGLLAGNQSEVSIAINPVDPNCIVLVSNNNADAGLFEGISTDGGNTWTQKIIADGFGTMVPAKAVANPTLAFDQFGNLFLSYLDFTNQGVTVAYSTDCGQTFLCFATLTSPFPPVAGQPPGTVDRPSLAVGPGGGAAPGSVWVTYEATPPSVGIPFGSMIVAGATVSGLGSVNPFSFLQVMANSTGADLGDVAVGPSGEVAVSWQNPPDLAGTSRIFTSFNPSGITGTFTTSATTTFTSISGFDRVPPQSVKRIDAAVGLAYDTSGGPHNGRLYMVFTTSSAINAGCTDIMVQFSENGGATWSVPVEVTDNPLESAEILPQIAVDPITGHIAVSWLSARNDPGSGLGDRDGKSNDDVEEFASVSLDFGATFLPNVQIANAPSEAALANHNSGQDFGAFTGLAFYNDILFPAWPDNSTTLVGNPDPNNFDIATARVTFQFLVASALSVNATSGVPFQGVVATFVDTAPDAATRTAADYTAVINWGDNQTSGGTIAQVAGTQYSVTGTHTYARAKKYPVTITIVDTVNGNSATVTGLATVQSVAPPNPLSASLVAGAVVDVNKQVGNQSEVAIAINPTNPLNIVIAANQNAPVATQLNAQPIVVSSSFDGGLTWTATDLTGGYGVLVSGIGHPSLAFDQFGNLFLSVHDSTRSLDAISLSTDGGRTFIALTTFEAAPHARNVIGEPKLAIGPGTTSPGSVWIFFLGNNPGNENPALKAVGAPVYGLGQVGPFAPQEDVPAPAGGNSGGISIGDVSIGPEGQVLVTYQAAPLIDEGPSNIYTNLDPDGLGGAGFGAAIPVPALASPLLPAKTTTTFVGGLDPIPAVVSGINAAPGVAYDRGGGVFSGRVYMVYVDASALRSPNTDIYVRYSDDDGQTWSDPLRVNDDQTQNSQFLPRIAVDQVTGHVAVSWYDARNDPGFGPGDRDGHANDDVEFYAAVSIDGGVTFSPNVQVQGSPSEAAIAGQNFGGYTGLAFFNDAFYPVWADNSTTLNGNPDPNTFDIATARVSVAYDIPIDGRPNPIDIRGVLNGDPVTNINRVNFIGTTLPGASVTLFAQANGQPTPLAVGSTIAGPTGAWSITTSPLPDGNYNIFAQATSAGRTSSLVPILPGNGQGQLIIDTIGPRVNGLSFAPLKGQIVITFQDERSGLDQASLANAANYVLTKASQARQVFVVTSISVSPQVSPTAPQVVILTFNNGKRLRGLDYVIRVIAGGVSDLATNALDGEFLGVFPSGDRHPGGDFVARLDSVHNTIYPAAPPTAPGGKRRPSRAPKPAPTARARNPIAPPSALAIRRQAEASPASTDVHDRALAQLTAHRNARRRG
jgi:Bacterial Ig-like domain